MSSSPTRDEPEEAFGERQHGDSGRDGPVFAVKGDFEPAAHAGSVDGPYGGVGQIHDALEGCVPGPAAFHGHVLARDRSRVHQVGSDAEDEGFSGQHERPDVLVGFDLVQGFVEAPERAFPESVRFFVILPVVHGHDGDPALGGVVHVDVELGDQFGHFP